MRLDIGNSGRIDPTSGINLFQEFSLRPGIRGRQRIGLAAVVDSAAANDSQNLISILLSAAERLEKHSSNPFSANISIGVFIKCFAFSVLAEHSGFAEGYEYRGCEQKVYTARDRHLRLTPSNTLHGPVNRDQGTGTRGINRFARTSRIENVRYAIR